MRAHGMRVVSLMLVALSAGVAACGSSNDLPTAAGQLVILDTTVDLVSGANCATGGTNVDFISTLNTTVSIDVSGPSSLTPQFVVYYPDYVRVLAGSSANGAGKATTTVKLPEGGTYHITACDTKGVAGKLRIIVTKQSG
jgi:hypothetical protein